MDKLELEKQFLEKVKETIYAERKEIDKTLEKIPWEYKGRYAEVKWGDEDLVKDLTSMNLNRLRKIENLENNPYFGSFLYGNFDEEPKDIRIGKTNIASKNNMLVLDWRSPICTLYYDQSLGPVSYKTFEGIKNGNLYNKRQILINNGEIISIKDVDLVSDDELLQPYLDINADNRMKIIIASIQAEQNAIIREPISKNIIIQGVAGSGKTSVALHRIAYLLYNNSRISADRFAIIGPNKYFLNYISSILPDLDTENVVEYTIEDLSKEIIAEKDYKIETSAQEFSRFMNNKLKDEKSKQFKGSLEYKQCLIKFLQDYFISCIDEEIKFEDIVIVTKEEIKKGLNININTNYNYNKLINKNVNNLIQKIKNQYEDRYYDLVEPLRQEMLKYPLRSDERFSVIARMDELKDIIKKGCSKELKKIIKPLLISPIKLYRLFLENIDKYININEKDLSSFKTESLKMLKKKIIPYEDIAGICFLSLLRNGTNYYDKYCHVVIDEAQDYSLFEFDILKTIFNQSTFSIFGDLAQSIYSYRSILSWEDLQNEIFHNDCEIMNMLKSYRTTKEITEGANNILRNLNLLEANPVIRTGPNINTMEADKNIEFYYLEKIKEYIDKGYKSIGIICKDELEMKYLKKILDKYNLEYHYITSSDVEYKGGISLLTAYLAKGLEFDAIIINDASNEKYNQNSIIDMHLLYVAMTRALHELSIFHSGPLCEVINDLNISCERNAKILKRKL